jgi:hypothetical protein
MLPSIGRVRVEAARDRVIVHEEIQLPRGEWQSGGLDLYAAFGAPGTPLAVDARLVAAPPGASESRWEDAGDPVSIEPAIRNTAGSQLVLGRPQMAGVVAHVRESDLRRAFSAGDLAGLRLRTLLAPPVADAAGRREIVVRLGSAAGVPLTLGQLQVVSLEARPWISRAEAVLCGPDADPWPLSLSVSPKPAAAPLPGVLIAGPIAPAMAIRHASDDLCVRWWADKT